MDALDVTIVNIALPDTQQDLGFSLGDRQWIVTAYSLALGSLLLLDRVCDLVGRRMIFRCITRLLSAPRVGLGCKGRRKCRTAMSR